MVEYWINFIYLAAFFCAFTWYRKLTLAEYQISSYHFGAGVIEALILAKVVLIGNALHLGKGFGNKPLIWPTLYKALVFVLFTGVFFVIEHTIVGIIHGQGWAEGVQHILIKGRDELLARCLVMFFSFIPFFAFQELSEASGEGKISAMFFRGREKSQ